MLEKYFTTPELEHLKVKITFTLSVPYIRYGGVKVMSIGKRGVSQVKFRVSQQRDGQGVK